MEENAPFGIYDSSLTELIVKNSPFHDLSMNVLETENLSLSVE